jgi:hypothetical protein
MNTFRKSNPTKTVMFVVTYDDARTAYLWVDGVRAGDDWTLGPIARAHQEKARFQQVISPTSSAYGNSTRR